MLVNDKTTIHLTSLASWPYSRSRHFLKVNLSTLIMHELLRSKDAQCKTKK